MKRSGIQRFEDLRVWQVGRELVKGVYRATRTQALKHDAGLIDQMTRAAVSITSNIAEGHERGSRVQNVEFCFYAKGSAGELRSQVINARDVELLDEKAFKWLHARCEERIKAPGGVYQAPGGDADEDPRHEIHAPDGSSVGWVGRMAGQPRHSTTAGWEMRA